MKSPGFSDRFSLSKLCAALLSLLFVVVVSSCSQKQGTGQETELPGDREITTTIQSQFEVEESVPADSIDVETEDGVVTLNGNISNFLAKKEANRIAQSTYGVLSVVNNLKITADRPDRAIDRDVDAALASDPVTETWEINSDVNNGVVTLTGRVDSWQEKDLAAAVAGHVKGVKEIENNITVLYDEHRSDKEIRAEVEQKLKMSSQVNADMVEVSVEEGAVTLSGAIGSAYEKMLVQDLARVAGVESVAADRLEVHPEYENAMFRSDNIDALPGDEIKQAIEDALRYDPRVPANKISVRIDDNTAVLEGSVLYLNAKMAAESDARNTAGINSVENNITVERKVVVEPQVPTTDEAVSERLRYAIQRDPYVEFTELKVTVEKGIARIRGTVDSQFEKDQLYQIAANVKGVIAIDNNVNIES
ncbi:MAG: BON domain-containing protein [Balneolaceae bacterium]|nr:BON domain-containing protein [Balneolaceae bacterium]